MLASVEPMSDWVQNPRRSPRLTVRCPVVIDHGGVAWNGETEDVGPCGCQIVSPRPLPAGEVLRLTIESAAAGRPLPVMGRVAWAGSRGRHRAGIRFSPGKPGSDPAAWFRRLVESRPDGEAGMNRAPERLSRRTPLFLLPPPQFILDLEPDEVALLRTLRDGVTVGDVVRGAPQGDGLATRLIFALLERRILTLSLGEATPAWRWHALLADGAAAAPRRPPIPPCPGPAPRALLRVEVPDLAWAVPPPVPPPAPSREEPPRAAVEAPHAGVPGPSTPYGATERRRPPEAQECLDRAVSAASTGEIAGAIALLRRGLALSPRDPVISAHLGALAFRDRTVGSG